MQPPTAPPRQDLTPDRVVDLIQRGPAITVAAGCELLTPGLDVIEDVTGSLRGGSVERHFLNTLHGAATILLDQDIPFASALLRPYLVLSDWYGSARFNLGAYRTDTPARPFGQGVRAYTVRCVDVLTVLDEPVGDAYAVAVGTPYLAAVEEILTGRGITRYLIDQARADAVLPVARTWAPRSQLTWLTLVNDLLAAVGYAGVWSDWDGQIRVAPYELPAARAVEWVYAADRYAIHGPAGEVEHDYADTPNRWIGWRQNEPEGAGPPVEGNGRFEFVNQSSGETSVESRGRTITREESFDVADQAALVDQVMAMADADMQVGTRITTTTAPNPLSWHGDKLRVADPEIHATAEWIGTDWVLPLDGGDMSHEWRLI